MTELLRAPLGRCTVLGAPLHDLLCEPSCRAVVEEFKSSHIRALELMPRVETLGLLHDGILSYANRSSISC
jgi:hypothetical protein